VFKRPPFFFFFFFFFFSFRGLYIATFRSDRLCPRELLDHTEPPWEMWLSFI
jgi:hypothetical protein